MKKRILALLLSVLMLGSVTACKDHSQKAEGTTEEPQEELQPNPATDFEYRVSEDQSGIIITKYVGTSKHVIIPSEIEGMPVISIHYVTDWQIQRNIGAFDGSDIQSVVIPESVKVLNLAFFECAQLREVTFWGDSQLYSLFGAFEGCTSLEKIDLSNTAVKIIDLASFNGCTNLKEIKFPNTLEKIGERAFYECTSLIEVDFPATLTEIGREAFGYCSSLKRVVIPPQLYLNGFDEIRFHHVDALEEIVFEEGRESIVGYAFFSIKSNAKIYIPSSVKQFGCETFFIYEKVDFVFEGDCPEISGSQEVLKNPTIHYDPNTKGWDTCVWRDQFAFETIK